MRRLLIIPAAGRGSRLGFAGPKALCPVAGRPMLDWLLERYAGVADHFVIVAASSARARIAAAILPNRTSVSIAVQEEPLGMLPAIRCADPFVREFSPDEVWVTWCDQVGISEATVERLSTELAQVAGAVLVFPTVRQTPPYIHFTRDDRGHITGVLHRREGDAMPATGESDAGLFALRRPAFLDDLPAFERESTVSQGTGERNFLPFIPWLAARQAVRTFTLDDPREAAGVNTPEDLAAMELFLRERA